MDKRSTQNTNSTEPLELNLGHQSKRVINDFRDFMATGNIVNFAVGILVGNSLSAVIRAFITDIFDPILSKITGKTVLLVNQKIILGQGEIVISWGHFVSQMINFLITAIAVYIVIRGMQKTFMKKSDPDALSNDEVQVSILQELQLNNRILMRTNELQVREEKVMSKEAELKSREDILNVKERFNKPIK